MAEIKINSFFTKGGFPAVDIDNDNPQPDGLNYPRIRIWDITTNNHLMVLEDQMVPVTDGSAEDGFYTYTFTDANGFSTSKRYLVRSDAGPSLSQQERYQVTQIDPEQISLVDLDAIANAVWDEPALDHLAPGSMGLSQNQTKTNTEQLVLNLNDVADLISLLLKYETNRTKIDTVNMELVVFDDDCTTELRRFKLFDSNGNPNTEEVCERVPVSASDNLPVCP